MGNQGALGQASLAKGWEKQTATRRSCKGKTQRWAKRWAKKIDAPAWERRS